MSRKAKVQAYDVKDKVMVDMQDPKPVYTESTSRTGKLVKRYRLVGMSANDHKLSKFVGADEAKKYGVPKKVAAKAKAPKKSCKVKYEECEEKATAKRGKKKVAAEPLDEKVGDLENAVEEVKKTAKKAGAKAKTARAKKAVKEVVDVAEEIEEKVEEVREAADEVRDASPKKTPKKAAAKGRKPAAKGGKKPAAKGKKGKK